MSFFPTSFDQGILKLREQNTFILTHKYRKLIFAAGFIGILLWQLVFVFKPAITEDHRRKDARGFTQEYAEHFFYFYYYLDLFPVATHHKPLTYSKEGALENIREHGDSLVMEWNHWARLGENARIFLFLPKAWLTGSAERPDIMHFNYITFIGALLLLYVCFWKFGKPLLGFFIVLFFGSSPFLLYETYCRPNIFALMAVNTLLLLCINLGFFKQQTSRKYLWLMPLASGILVATAIHIRGENVVLLASCLFIYLTASSIKPLQRLVLAAICILSFTLCKSSWQEYFDKKFKEAHSIVTAAGGNPYNGTRWHAHTFWHPVFCGLGDYDTQYGYTWSDTIAYRYALPILKEKYNLDLKYKGGYTLDEYFDPQKKYYKKLELYNEYDQVMKDKVIGDISRDPLWYAKILVKRIFSVFRDTSPVWLKAGKIQLPLPINGLMILPFMVVLLYKKKWFEVRLLLFSMPLAVTSILIYSKGNTTYNSCFHLFLTALVCSWFVEIVFLWRKQKTQVSNSHA